MIRKPHPPTQPPQPRTPKTGARFQIVKLEERVAPSKWSHFGGLSPRFVHNWI